MSIRQVSRLTGPQLAEGLKKLPATRVEELRTALTTVEAGQETFLDGIGARLKKDGASAQGASKTDLLRAAALELARLERGIATTKVRGVGEVVSLAAVEKSFGKTMRALLEALEGVDVSGRLDPSGAVPLTRALIGETKVVYERLGLHATDEAVVGEMHRIYPTFDEATLDGLHRKFPGALPDRRALRSARALSQLEQEAKAVKRAVQGMKAPTIRELVKVMQGLGYHGFDAGRLAYLRERHPELVPSLSKVHTPEELEALADKIRAFIEKHPAATDKVLGRAFSLPIAMIVEAAEIAGLALTTTRTARILDPYDPLCDALVRYSLASRAKGEGIDVAAAALNRNPAFVKQFGAVTEAKLSVYVDEHLPMLATARGKPPWDGARPGAYDRAFAELARFFYSTPDIDEPRAFEAVRAFDPAFTKYRLKTLREEHPDLSLSTRVMDKSERERMARVVGDLARANPELSFKEIGELAWQQGLPRLDDQRVMNLRAEFPELIPKRVDRAVAARLAAIEAEIRGYIAEHPHASVAAVALAVGARETQVIKPLRRLRAEILETGQSRFTDVDRALIERLVRSAEPGETQGDILARVMKDKTFAARHQSLSANTLREVIVELVPEAADWKVYNLTVVARVLDEALQQAPEGRSLSKTIGDIQREHPGFPNYVSLLATGTRSMEKHIERVPFMRKYLGADGRLKLSSGAPRAELSEELAGIVAKAFAKAPPEWNNDRIFAEIHKDASVKRRYPVLGESTLTGLRSKFPGVIAARTAPTKNAAEPLADAKKLAAELHKIVDGGGKITLDEIAKRWHVDPQYFRRLINRNPALFPMYKKRYEITEHVARTMGAVIATMPMGVTLDEAPRFLERSGLFPPDMKLAKTLLLNAEAKFPALVPNLNERNQQLFLRMVCKELVTAKAGTSLAAIFADLKARTGQLPVSLERFTSEIVPGWQKLPAAKRPAWVSAAMTGGKLTVVALGKPAASFPAQDLRAVERDLAQLAEVPARLEMLERIVARKARNTFADWNVLSIQHLLGSNFRFVEAVQRMGAKKEDVLTVGIPYSTSEVVARTMNEGGLETFTPPLNIAAWERQVEDALHEMVERSKKNGKKIVVFDDGGFVAKILHEKPWAKEYQKLFRIVEQTTRGITVAKQYDLQVPLVNYAQDPAKNLEGSMIGEVVLDRIYQKLDAIGQKKKLKGMPVTCVGAGVIGLPTALDLARAGAKVTIYDLDPEARWRAKETAKQEGLDIVIADNPQEAFTGAKMIVGSTGHTSIGPEAFQHMADGCILVSTSSKLVEIDMGLLDAKATKDGQLGRTVVDADSHPPTCSYLLDDGRKITVLADGFPVNFDGAVNCVDPADIQLTHAGMLLAGIQATWSDLDPGLRAFDDKLRRELLDDWKDVKAARASNG